MVQKSGQATRMLIYVLTLVVVALVLIFGYRAISALTSTGQTASLLKFKNEFSNTVEQGSFYGRVDVQDLTVAGDYKQLCLAGIGATAEDFSQYPLVKDAIGTENNAFLVADATIEPFKVDTLEIDGGGDCFPISGGKIKLRFEGKGDRTKVSFVAG